LNQKQKYSAWRGGYLSRNRETNDERNTNETIPASGAPGAADTQARSNGSPGGKARKAS